MPFPKAEIQRLFRYGIVGLATNVSLYVVFLFFLRLDLLPAIAVGLCYGLGVAMSYLLNRRWTFSSTASHRQDLLKFLLAYGIGLISTLLTITLLMVWLSPEAAQIINIGTTAIVIYGSLRLVRFGQNKDDSHAY
jgi:putative flippase GtrA